MQGHLSTRQIYVNHKLNRRKSTYISEIHCVVPENTHTFFMESIFSKTLLTPVEMPINVLVTESPLGTPQETPITSLAWEEYNCTLATQQGGPPKSKEPVSYYPIVCVCLKIISIINTSLAAAISVL